MIGTYGALCTRAGRGHVRPCAAAFPALSLSLLLAFFATVMLPLAALAQASGAREVDEAADWMPSFSISWGAHSQPQDGTTSTGLTALPPSSGDSIISTMFQFEGKLHTPLQLDIPGQPRLFISAGAQLPLADELIAERIDTSFDRILDPVDFVAACPPTPGFDTCALEVRNRTTIDTMWYVGLGVDLTIPAFDTRFHIAPAIEYFGMSVHTVGDFKRSSAGTGLDDFVEVANSVGDSEIYHGIAGSLTLSVEVYEEGPWRWSMFIQPRVAYLLTDPLTSTRSRLGASEIIFVTDLDPPGWKVGGKRAEEALVVQGTAGIQLQWTGL